MLSKQAGFTIIEVVVSMVIFTIVVVGSGMMLKHSLAMQKEMTVNRIVLNEMQERLRVADGIGDLCDVIDTSSFTAAEQEYFVECANEIIEVSGVETKWPILAVAPTLGLAIACANNNLHEECYVIGR